ncbi:enoyl-CoA hydratase/isomerase family protein [Planococcus salinarum]|uniref:enoyl-CoA hydratase/isomerase family protein n=1 Tax=Planococcus salinarum TaxID=622695 RepID=UPI000E3B67AF|nr:enoyl-CoA hydratase/isomerase family protein [Planococcus salinarum]TAA72087.1 enoyl-CoA hydratase/isomerase family protein [Planococcus salinarum]
MAYKIDTADGIMTFTIDRPEIRNAINDEVMLGLEKLVERAIAELPRLVVITATGDRAFCSGGDLSVFHALETEEEAYPMLKRMGDVLYAIKTLPVPVAALVNGTAVGGGCEIATACDYRLVRSHVNAGFIQGTLAITSGWGGGTYLFEALKHDHALKMLSEARLYSAEELYANGWATAIIQDEGDVERFLESFRNVLPEVHRAYKEMAVRKWKATDLEARVEAEIRRCARLWASDAHHAAVANFLKRPKK